MGLRGPKPKRGEVTWSPELAYAVGLLVTDGNLSPDGRHIVLVSKDIEQLQNFTKCIRREIRIGENPKGPFSKGVAYRVQFSDVTLYMFLLSIGLTPNKTKTIASIDVPEEFFFDFLRGHFDGDGSFSSYYDPRWKSSFMFYLTLLSASEPHIQWLRNTITQHIGIRGHITHSGPEGSRIYNLRFAKRETLRLLNELYPNKRVVCLSRKRLKIERALRIVELSLPH